MPLLGSLLLDRGWISERQLDVALRRQREMGGRLGTSLLEIGAVSEGLLLEVLSEQFRMPVAAADDLRNIGREVFALVPARLAIRSQAIPFRRVGDRLDVALSDVRNVALTDELSFVTGKRLRVHVAVEARVYEAMERFFGKPCPARFSTLLDRLDYAGGRGRVKAEPVRRESRAAASATLDNSLAATPDAEPNRTSTGADSPPHLARTSPPAIAGAPAVASIPRSGDPPPSPIDPGADESWFEWVASPDEIGSLLLELVGRQMRRVVLLRARQDRITGWMGSGPNLNHDRLRSFATAFDQPSIFLNLMQGSPFYRGALPSTPAHTMLSSCWSGDLTSECLVVPLRIRERLVAAIYADCDGASLREPDLPQTLRLASKAAIALEMCILRRKLQLF